MHAKTDSEVTSLAPSSPPRSPRRPMYFVQSPSRDSHDGEKTLTSMHSTPAALSPMASPRHSHQSRDSSSSRFSGPAKHANGGVRKGDAGDQGKSGRKSESVKPWKEIDVIEEEGLLEDQDEPRGLPKRCWYFLVFVAGFIVLFSFFALVLWGASRSQKPQIVMKSITFENFIIQSGTDASLVPTDMSTLNSTVKFTYRNTGTFFGIHVGADPFELTYNQLTLATGNMNKFYQARSSQRTVNVAVQGSMVPLYGSGPTLTSTTTGKTKTVLPVPLNLTFTVRSTAYVLGALVKPRFTAGAHCAVEVDLSKLNKAMPLDAKACQFF